MNHRGFLFYVFVVLLIFAFSPFSYPQNEGISLHGDFCSAVFAQGFEKNYNHPGNFMLGGQFNIPLSRLVELNAGIDFLWVELYGQINNINKQTEVFIPFIFGGAALNFNQWRIFGKIGVSLDESVNNIGSGKGWESSIMDFFMGYTQFGIKYPVYDALSLSTSASYYFGEKVKIESKLITFSTINLGLSYNLFRPEIISPVVADGVDEYKKKYSVAQSENKELYKQIVELHDRIKALESTGVKKVDTVSTPVRVNIPIKSISVDSINNVYNLHLRESLNLKDFIGKKGMKEEGNLILTEYNNIAASFKGLPEGIYLVCTIPDIKVLKKSESAFSRIKFHANPSFKNKLIIDIDVKRTEASNKMKLEMK